MEYNEASLPAIIDTFKKKLRIAVVYAGDKNEAGTVFNITTNTRSWKSYHKVADDIANALRTIGFQNTITLAEDVRLLDNLKEQKIDFVWLNSGGVQGYSPMAHAPSVLELAGIPYVGHAPHIASLLDNKHLFKGELFALNIPTARWFTWDMSRGDFIPECNSLFNKAFANYSGPYIVKPISGRASLNVEVADTLDEVPGIIKMIYQKTKSQVMIEEYLSGDEYCISVCGGLTCKDGIIKRDSMPLAFSGIKRILDSDEKIFTSMDIKPINDTRARLLDKNSPEEREIIRQLHELARQIYLDFRLQTLVRLDVRADDKGKLYVLETNPKPDLKAFTKESVSLSAMGLNELDMTYEDLIYSLITARFDFLFAHRQENIHHLLRLL